MPHSAEMHESNGFSNAPLLENDTVDFDAHDHAGSQLNLNVFFNDFTDSGRYRRLTHDNLHRLTNRQLAGIHFWLGGTTGFS